MQVTEDIFTLGLRRFFSGAFCAVGILWDLLQVKVVPSLKVLKLIADSFMFYCCKKLKRNSKDKTGSSVNSVEQRRKSDNKKSRILQNYTTSKARPRAYHTQCKQEHPARLCRKKDTISLDTIHPQGTDFNVFYLVGFGRIFRKMRTVFNQPLPISATSANISNFI